MFEFIIRFNRGNLNSNENVQSNLALRIFSVRAILVLKVKHFLILTVIYYINHQLVNGDLVLKVKQVLILMVLKAKFDCTSFSKN